MKIAYLGIDILQSVLQAALREDCEILKLFTCETDNVTEFNRAVLETARRRGIPVSTKRIGKADLQALAEAGCELLLCAGYYYRVPLTDAFPMVNVHPAPLPDCRGAWPMPLILLGAYDVGGVAFHRMAADFDAGDCLLQQTFTIAPLDTLEDYMQKVDALVPTMVHALFSDLPGCLRRAVPQGAGRYLPNPDASAWTVNADMTAAEADRILRAFYGYECLYRQGGALYELIGARAVRGEIAQPFPLRDGFISAPRVRKIREGF